MDLGQNCLSKLKARLIWDNATGLSDCAYLNLNKRGSFHTCDQKRPGEYTRRYQSFFHREIELLAPERIVVCGELQDPVLWAILDDVAFFCGYTRYWVYPRHPSRYSNK